MADENVGGIGVVFTAEAAQLQSELARIEERLKNFNATYGHQRVNLTANVALPSQRSLLDARRAISNAFTAQGSAGQVHAKINLQVPAAAALTQFRNSLKSQVGEVKIKVIGNFQWGEKPPTSVSIPVTGGGRGGAGSAAAPAPAAPKAPPAAGRTVALTGPRTAVAAEPAAARGGVAVTAPARRAPRAAIPTGQPVVRPEDRTGVPPVARTTSRPAASTRVTREDLKAQWTQEDLGAFSTPALREQMRGANAADKAFIQSEIDRRGVAKATGRPTARSATPTVARGFSGGPARLAPAPSAAVAKRISPDAVADRYIKWFSLATQSEIKEGLNWYDREMRGLMKMTAGTGWSRQQVHDITAAFSRNNVWGGNKTAVAKFTDRWRGGARDLAGFQRKGNVPGVGFASSIEDALAVAKGGRPLAGHPKEGPFGQALGGDPNAIAIDRWMSVMQGYGVPGKATPVFQEGVRRARGRIAADRPELAGRLDMRAMQAIPWVVARNRLRNVRGKGTAADPATVLARQGADISPDLVSPVGALTAEPGVGARGYVGRQQSMPWVGGYPAQPESALGGYRARTQQRVKAEVGRLQETYGVPAKLSFKPTSPDEERGLARGEWTGNAIATVKGPGRGNIKYGNAYLDPRGRFSRAVEEEGYYNAGRPRGHVGRGTDAEPINVARHEYGHLLKAELDARGFDQETGELARKAAPSMWERSAGGQYVRDRHAERAAVSQRAYDSPHEAFAEAFSAVESGRKDRWGMRDLLSKAGLVGAPALGGARGFSGEPRTVAHSTQSNEDLRRVATQYNIGAHLPPPLQGAAFPLNRDFSTRTARGFEALPVGPDRADKRAYSAFARETQAQYGALSRAGYRFSESQTDPYPQKPGGPTKMQQASEDVSRNKHLTVFAGSAEHQYLTNEQNVMFRKVHDLMGHLAEGFSIGPTGEFNAAAQHSRMYSPLAQKAMLAETHGQNSVVNFSPTIAKEFGRSIAEVNRAAPGTIYADQKATVLPTALVREFRKLTDPVTAARLQPRQPSARGLGNEDPYSASMRRDQRESMRRADEAKRSYADMQAAAGGDRYPTARTTASDEEIEARNARLRDVIRPQVARGFAAPEAPRPIAAPKPVAARIEAVPARESRALRPLVGSAVAHAREGEGYYTSAFGSPMPTPFERIPTPGMREQEREGRLQTDWTPGTGLISEQGQASNEVLDRILSAKAEEAARAEQMQPARANRPVTPLLHAARSAYASRQPRIPAGQPGAGQFTAQPRAKLQNKPRLAEAAEAPVIEVPIGDESGRRYKGPDEEQRSMDRLSGLYGPAAKAEEEGRLWSKPKRGSGGSVKPIPGVATVGGRPTARRLSPAETGALLGDEPELQAGFNKVDELGERLTGTRRRTQVRSLPSFLTGLISGAAGGNRAIEMEKKATVAVNAYKASLQDLASITKQVSTTFDTKELTEEGEERERLTEKLKGQRAEMDRVSKSTVDLKANAVKAVETAEKAAGGGLRNIAAGFVSNIAAGVAFGAGFAAVQAGLEGFSKAIAPSIDSLTDYRESTDKVTGSLSQLVRAQHGYASVAFASVAANAGLGDAVSEQIGPVLEQRAAVEAGNKAFGEQIDLIHGAIGAQNQLDKARRGESYGPLIEPGAIPGITGTTGGFLGTPIGGTPPFFEQLLQDTGVAGSAGQNAFAGGMGAAIGGVAGGASGVVAGAALGTAVLPGPGTVIGGLIGGAVGTIAGGTVGGPAIAEAERPKMGLLPTGRTAAEFLAARPEDLTAERPMWGAGTPGAAIFGEGNQSGWGLTPDEVDKISDSIDGFKASLGSMNEAATRAVPTIKDVAQGFLLDEQTAARLGMTEKQRQAAIDSTVAALDKMGASEDQLAAARANSFAVLTPTGQPVGQAGTEDWARAALRGSLLPTPKQAVQESAMPLAAQMQLLNQQGQLQQQTLIPGGAYLESLAAGRAQAGTGRQLESGVVETPPEIARLSPEFKGLSTEVRQSQHELGQLQQAGRGALMELVQIADIRLGNLGDGASSLTSQFTSLETKIGDVGGRIRTLQLANMWDQATLQADQYTEQIRLMSQSLADAQSFVSGQPSAGPGGGELGVLQNRARQLERSSFEINFQQQTLGLESQQLGLQNAQLGIRSRELSFQSTELQFQSRELGFQAEKLQLIQRQRQINFQRSLAGFVTPGETPGEIAARSREAELDANVAQKQQDIAVKQFGFAQQELELDRKQLPIAQAQLEIDRQQVDLQGRQVALAEQALGISRAVYETQQAMIDVQAARAIENLVHQIDLATRARTLVITMALRNEAIANLQEKLKTYQARISEVVQRATSAQQTFMARAAELTATYGGLITDWNDKLISALQQYVRDAGLAIQGMYNSLSTNTPSGNPTADSGKGSELLTHFGASGFLGSVSSATNFTVGEAGNETVAILSNPRHGAIPAGAWGGGGGGGGNVTVLVTGNQIGGSEQDLDRFASIIARKVEEIQSRRGSLLGLRGI